jgi:hypothetical protein
VMLSRAKHGLYLLGNAIMLERSNDPFWKSVMQTLRRRKAVSTALPVCCQNHPNKVVLISEAVDFKLKAADGGCMEQCQGRLSLCGHACSRYCHADDPRHEMTACLRPCERLVEDSKHPCKKLCCDDCKPCKVDVTHDFSCGHIDRIPCHMRDSAKCKVLVPVKMPICGHECKVVCSIARSGKAVCLEPCGVVLPCGHQCREACSKCPSKNNNNGAHPPCSTKCNRSLTCGHQCDSTCHGEGKTCSDDCKKKCTTSCAHSKCSLMCSDACVPCAESCTWSCSHRGSCILPCGAPCTRLPCDRRCSEVLSCGHRCPSLCGEKCPVASYALILHVRVQPSYRKASL